MAEEGLRGFRRGGVVAAPEERMRVGETVGESGLVGAAGSL